MALSADRVTQKKIPGGKGYPVKTNTVIYAGGMVMIDSAGFAVPAADAASSKVVGVATHTINNNPGADGAKWVEIETGIFLFSASSITQAMVGQMMYVVDDQTFDDGPGTNYVKAGRLMEFVSTTSGWIKIDEAGVGAKTTDATSSWVQATADLVNELKTIINKWV